MSSIHKDFTNNNGRVFSQRSSRNRTKVTPSNSWRQETPKRSASRSKVSTSKKIKKIEKVRMPRHFDLLKPKQTPLRRPNPPHNTTQYIIDANNTSSDSPSMYIEKDRFKHDFQYHSMAGSMMELMKNNFAQMYEKCTKETNYTEEPSPRLDQVDDMKEDEVEVSIMSEQEKEKLADIETSLFSNSNEVSAYQYYIKQAEMKEDLQGLVKELVSLLNQKDEEICELKSKIDFQRVFHLAER